MDTSIKEINANNYRIPLQGVPSLHRSLQWYATADDRVLGVVVLDLVDHDFSWVVLSEEPQDDVLDGTGYRAVNLACSLPSQSAARQQLHKTMLEEHERILRGIPL
jgi:hypothetical protein